MSTIVTEAPVATYEIGDERGKPQIYVWIGRADGIIIDTSEEARAAAAVLLEAADQLDITTIPGARIIRWGWIPAITEVVIYHRVTDGVERGEIAIPFTDRDDPKDSFAHKLAQLQPGETLDHHFKFGPGFPKEHHSDTFVGVFRLKARLSDGRVLVAPVASAEVADILVARGVDMGAN